MDDKARRSDWAISGTDWYRLRTGQWMPRERYAIRGSSERPVLRETSPANAGASDRETYAQAWAGSPDDVDDIVRRRVRFEALLGSPTNQAQLTARQKAEAWRLAGALRGKPYTADELRALWAKAKDL